MNEGLRIIDCGSMAYAEAYQLQLNHHAEVLAAREAGAADPGRVLLLEHDPPVITITRRPSAAQHLVATPEVLAKAGVSVVETDRGGDITYHGPGQLVAYLILDLNAYHLGLHEYMRLLECAVIATCAGFGIAGERDACATGVWVPQQRTGEGAAKICAMGVRVRRWVTLHGLALNVTTNLDHFGLIVPCGLSGRSVTSLARELGSGCPTMPDVKRALGSALTKALTDARNAAPIRAG